MPRDILAFHNPTHSFPSSPDLAYEALPLLHRLRACLPLATTFRDACKRTRRWGVPPLFFFGKPKPNVAVPFPGECGMAVARRYPDAALAWAKLHDYTDDAFAVMAASADARRTARAIPGLIPGIQALAADHRRCRELAELFAVADDGAVTVLHPSSGAGFRILYGGIANLAQFHVLLADAVTGSPRKGYLAGERPDPRIVAAYRDCATDPEADVATARFQMYRPMALREDGTLPPRFQGSEEWFWGHESPAEIPSVNGERLLLIGEPAYRRQWTVRRRFSAVSGELHVDEVLSATAVRSWIDALRGRISQTVRVAEAA